MAEKIKVKVKEFPRVDFVISDTPSFMSAFAFVQTNRALAELTRDLISARLNNREEINLAPDRASALILYGTYWAPKDGEGILSQAKAFLINKSAEQKEKGERAAVVRGLPASFVEHLQKLGADFVEGLSDKDFVKAAVSNLKAREFKVAEKTPEDVEKAFILAVEGDRRAVWNDDVKVEVDAFTDRIIKKFKAIWEKEDDLKKVYERLQSLAEGVSYEIQRPYRLYAELLSGKNLMEALAPENPDSLFHILVGMDKVAALTVTLKKAYDPAYRPSEFAKLRFKSYEDVYTPEVLGHYLKTVMTPEMQETAKKLEAFYDEYGFMPPAYEVVEKAKEKGIENPFSLSDEEFVKLMEDVYGLEKEAQATLEEVEEEIDDLGVDL